MVLKIFTYPNNPRAAKALIAAQFVGVNVEVAKDFQMGVTNKTPEFLKMNPLGKVPVLQTDDGAIYESNAIARYVARLGKNNLFGANALEAGQIEQFIDFSVGEIDLPAAAWLYPIKGYVANNEAATKQAKKDIRGVLETLNKHLATRTFLVGERISLADIVVACSLVSLYLFVLDSGFRKQFQHTNRWFTTIVNQPEALAVLGNVELCAKMAVAPKVEKKAAAPVAEKKAEKKAEAAPAAAPAKKAKNPLDLLPKSSFVLDEWKRMYSNSKDTRGEAVPWFWKNFDKEGYCIYWADYKYNEDNTVKFMTNNLLGGWLQRLDSLRKYGFGVCHIFGDMEVDKCLDIRTVWVFRGQEIPFEMKDSPDFESYSFRKMNMDDADELTLFADFMTWEGEFKGFGKKWCSGKDFK